MLPARTRLGFSLIIALTLLTACGIFGSQGSPDVSSVNPTEPVTTTEATSATPQESATDEPSQPPDPSLATPQNLAEEEPLQGIVPEIPSVVVIPSSQSKTALAVYLKTTSAQLDWVNPGLTDPILPGTLVVIPPIYRVNQEETLSQISQSIQIPKHLLSALNPDLNDQETLTEGTVLAVPDLYIVPENTLLGSAAGAIDTSSESLLSANPELAEDEEITAGTVLVVPPESKEH